VLYVRSLIHPVSVYIHHLKRDNKPTISKQNLKEWQLAALFISALIYKEDFYTGTNGSGQFLLRTNTYFRLVLGPYSGTN
jgi:hypothetical protein